MSATTKREARQRARASVSISAVVKAKESKDSFWKLTTELINLSRSGAGFYIERKCEVGRLISLTFAMPKELRGYDVEKELYRVWGVVQHCSQVSAAKGPVFQVGVAFTGRNAPPSYHEDPLQSYRIAGMDEDGTWRIVEAKTNFVVRRHPRFHVPLEILLSAKDADANLVMDEAAKTENISTSGAAVYSSLKVDIGNSVKFDCVEHNFSALAIVRNHQVFTDHLTKLHLEFIDAEFPIEKVLLPDEKDILDEDDFSDE